MDLISDQLAPMRVVVTSGGVGVKKEINIAAEKDKDLTGSRAIQIAGLGRR